MFQLTNKRVLLGVTGGIAAYKSAELIRRLREAGAEVRVVMTKAAQEFITPLTLQTLSEQPVHTELLDPKTESTMGHIELARWADVILIAPASAEFIASYANGHARDLLTTLCLATNATIAVAPAMNQQMWMDIATQDNMSRVIERGAVVFGPASGIQACGEIGPGRMLEPVAIVDNVAKLFETDLLNGVRILITAGPTQEVLDPVRYLTNYSSGKMGYALAEAAVEAGASVELISGPTSLKIPERVKHIPVVTAQEMYERVFASIADVDIVIANAAVSDYRAKKISPVKVAKGTEEIIIELVQNPDIVADITALNHRPFVVGFAAETDNVIEKARNKLIAKNMNLIAANQVGLADRGFGSDNNALTVLWEGGQEALDLASKTQIARNFMTIVAQRYALYEKNSTQDS